jgi:RNA polymerase sigma-70 factor (ECF subfamily)
MQNGYIQVRAMSAILEPRLSALSTQWTLVVRAQAGGEDAREALAVLLPRYCAAIYRYLMSIIRDEAIVEDLCQEFAYRFTRGDFRHARPDKGRFRDYIKTAIIHLVGEHRRKARHAEKLIPFDSRLFIPVTDDSMGPEAEFIEMWRKELLNRTWRAFEEISAGTPPTQYDVLRLKADDPNRTSAQLAELLTAKYKVELTVPNIRQMIHRARTQFAELLVAEVADSIPSKDPMEIDSELADLKLLIYVK